jgi:phosphoribosyl 1,2-cyclic phosphate phosphodiesterase
MNAAGTTSSVELLFLGTGTSAGIPMIGCDCPVCTSTDANDRRTRPSVVISYDGRHILVDTTPELRLQCVANDVKMIDAVVYTHAHADHIMGLDDVRRFNTLRGGPLDCWADDATFATLRQCFGYAFIEPDPALKAFRPHLARRRIDPRQPFDVAGRMWTPVPLLHGTMPVNGFRVGNLAYCTDVSEIPESSFALLDGLDVLILDALQYKPHMTHFTIDQAIAAAARIGAKQTYFTHIAHGVSHATASETLPPGVRLAYDGLRVHASG